MPIKQLTLKDLQNPAIRAGIARIGHEFVAEAKHPAPFNTEHFLAVWNGLLTVNIGGFFVSLEGEEMTGLLGAAFVEDPFSGVMSGVENFWFVRQAHRGGSTALKLFKAFEDECDRRECKVRVMVHLSLDSLRPDTLAKFYVRKGYVLADQSFRKVL